VMGERHVVIHPQDMTTTDNMHLQMKTRLDQQALPSFTLLLLYS